MKNRILAGLMSVMMVIPSLGIGTIHVFAAKSSVIKYAVMIYGVEEDTLKDGSKAGLTFSPLTFTISIFW